MKKFELINPTSFDHHVWLVELHNDPVVLNNITDSTPITLDSHLSWWSKLNHIREERFIFTVDDVNAGFTKFYQIDRGNMNCVLGADLHKNFRGQGLAKPMWKLMLQHCFSDLNLHRVSLTTASFNLVAQKVYRDLGFVEEGRKIQSLYRDGIFYDEICMYLLKEMWNK